MRELNFAEIESVDGGSEWGENVLKYGGAGGVIGTFIGGAAGAAGGIVVGAVVGTIVTIVD